MNSGPRAASAAGPADRRLPRWAGKPVRRLTAGELAEALAYLERHRPDDDVLGRALAGEFARRTAAAEFARRTATAHETPAAQEPSAASEPTARETRAARETTAARETPAARDYRGT